MARLASVLLVVAMAIALAAPASAMDDMVMDTKSNELHIQWHLYNVTKVDRALPCGVTPMLHWFNETRGGGHNVYWVKGEMGTPCSFNDSSPIQANITTAGMVKLEFPAPGTYTVFCGVGNGMFHCNSGGMKLVFDVPTCTKAPTKAPVKKSPPSKKKAPPPKGKGKGKGMGKDMHMGDHKGMGGMGYRRTL